MLGTAGCIAASARAYPAGALASVADEASLAVERCLVSSALPAAFVCHGNAGAAVMLRRFRGADVRTRGEALLESVVAARAATGFAGFGEARRALDADLLTGAAGIALALLPFRGGAPGWDRILGMSTMMDEGTSSPSRSAP
jgi:hypothetical protein